MKQKTIIAALLISGALSHLNAVSFTGSAITNTINAAASTSFVVVDTAGDGLDFNASSVGFTFALDSFVGATDDYVVGVNFTTTGFAAGLTPGSANFTLDTFGITADDAFYIVLFGSETTASVTTTAGLGFNTVNAVNWLVPGANNSSLAFPADFTQLDSVNATALTVVPEPSTYAALAGLLALGYVMVGRRK